MGPDAITGLSARSRTDPQLVSDSPDRATISAQLGAQRPHQLHPSLGMLTPVEYELRHATTTARNQAS